MKITYWRLNLLVGLNCFIIFFLLVEHLIQVPTGIQVIGRMHPMLLHFPIVLLVLTGLLVNFPKRFQQSVSISILTRELLFVSALTSALTVIMGLLLAREGGYGGSEFLWHKWVGVAISFVSWGLLWIQANQHRLHRYFFVGATNLCLTLVLIAGHFGASLTHGADFVISPLTSSDANVFNLDNADVFEDAVLPIFKAKCLSCHNPSKPKGDLVLSDSASILKGGENGPLLLGATTTESLLIQRLSLDISHEHHMPPEGKPQLTAAELALLQAWVANGAQFGLPVAKLRADNDLMLAIQAIYEVEEEERFDFASADEASVKKLSSPYRVIKPIANGSPALAVSFFGKSFYHQQPLSDLKPIIQQVVNLNLGGMPIDKKDVEMLKSFSNLRRVNLNNTPVSDEDIALLSAMPTLKIVSLSGTGVTIEGAKSLLANDAIQKVYVWNTAIHADEVSQLAASYPTKYIEGGFVSDETSLLPLTTPQVTPARTFFRDNLEISLSHAIPGVEIRYSLDGSEPDSVTGTLFDHPIVIDRAQKLRMKAYKKGWLPSELVERAYVKSPNVPDRMELQSSPYYLFPARMERSLMDLESGGNNHADGRWQGYLQSPLAAALYFDKPTTVDTLMLSVLQNYASVPYMPIYPPEHIEIWGGKDSANVRLVAKIAPDLMKHEHLTRRRLIPCPVKASDLQYLKLVAKPYQHIPDGYPHSGGTAWLFVDEIILK